MASTPNTSATDTPSPSTAPQGATFDSAHVLAAGGGRELAYVALSRARDHTTIHATADNLGQAVDDLQADWGVARHQRWITDTTAQPGRQPIPERVRPVLSSPLPPPPVATAIERRAEALGRLIDLEQDLNDLLAGTGRWTNTPAGEAARAYDVAEAQLVEMRRTANDPTIRRRERRAATKALPALEKAFNEASAQWSQVGQPEADRLWAEAEQARQDHTRFDREVQRERLDQIQNSDPARNLPDRGLGIG